VTGPDRADPIEVVADSAPGGAESATTTTADPVLNGPVLPDVVAEAGRRFGDARAFVAATGWALSYAQLDRLSDEVAAHLSRRGIGPGDVVALALPSTPDYVVTYVALAKVGAATAGINPSLAPPERARLVDLVHPRLVLGTETLAAGLPGDVLEIQVAGSAAELLVGLRDYGAAPPPLQPDPDRPVALVFTSGTTGTPKAAVFTDRQLGAISRLEAGEAWGGGGPAFASTQFAHVGFMTKLPWTLRLGGVSHLLPRWRAADVLDLVERERVSTIGAVAPQLALMLADPDFDERDLSCVQSIIAGGAASPAALVEESRRRFGAAYSIRYSSTESGGMGTGTAFDAPDEEALQTAGRPRPGVEVQIRDGEVCLRSPAVMTAYWDDPESTAAVLEDGWLRTGDLGELDDRGCLRLLGRSKEMFIRGGYNVFPMEVEGVLASHPAVAEVVVVPRPEAAMGEIGVAVVVPRPGLTPPTLEALRAFARPHLAGWKLPEAIRIVDGLPRTAMLKLDRRALAAAEADEAGDSPS
jgi:acyl-CoA synthetase (AMP-forming)/AMP-acid ligase II